MELPKPLIELTNCVKIEELLGFLATGELRTAVLNSDLVCLPEETWMDTSNAVFRPETSKFFDYARENAPQEYRIEVAATDEDYQEIGLHGAELWLPTILILKEAGEAMGINLISSYVYDRLRGALAPKDLKVHSKVYLNRENGTVRIEYAGPADTYERVMKDAFRTPRRKD